jgi:vacuolar-type H+-ATPase subunit H
MQSEQTRIESEQSQQEAASRSEQQLEQAMNHAHTLVAEAKTKAERIRGDSERELAAATQRRDSINAQLSNVRQMLAALGGAAVGNALDMVAPEAAQPQPAAAAAAPAATPTAPVVVTQKPVATAQGVKDPKPSDEATTVATTANASKVKDAGPTDHKVKSEPAQDKKPDSSQAVGAKG